jgi:fucose permease
MAYILPCPGSVRCVSLDQTVGTGRGRLVWSRIVVSYAAMFLVGVLAGSGGVLLASQIQDYGVDKATISVIFLTSPLGYVTAAAISGGLIHRFGPRAVVVAGTVIMLTGVVVVGLRPSFLAFVLVQIVVGAGTSTLETCLNAYLSTLSGSLGLLNMLHAFFGAGALVGPLVAVGLLKLGLPWNGFYLVLAAALAALVAALVLTYPPEAPAADVAEKPRMAAALRYSAVWVAGVFLAIYVGVELAVGNWAFIYLTEDRAFGLGLAGGVVSGYWTGLTVGRLVLNPVFERVGVGVGGLVGTCLAGIAVCAAAVWLLPWSYAAIAGLVLMGFFLGPVYPSTVAVMPRLVPAALVGTAIGLLIGASAAGALFPLVAGLGAEHLGPWSLLPFALALTLVLVALWAWLARRVRVP